LHLFRFCSEADCSDVLFATMDGTLWQRLVGERGWTAPWRISFPR